MVMVAMALIGVVLVGVAPGSCSGVRLNRIDFGIGRIVGRRLGEAGHSTNRQQACKKKCFFHEISPRMLKILKSLIASQMTLKRSSDRLS